MYHDNLGLHEAQFVYASRHTLSMQVEWKEYTLTTEVIGCTSRRHMMSM